MAEKWLAAIAAALAFAVNAHADVWLTSTGTLQTVNVPANSGGSAFSGPTISGSPVTYDSLTGTSLGGVSYTNAFASTGDTAGSRAVAVGDMVHTVGVELNPRGFTLGAMSGGLIQNTQVTAVFAATGTATTVITGPSTLLTASIGQLVVNFYSRGSGPVDRNDPTTWGVNPANLIQQYVLHVTPGGSQVSAGDGFALRVSPAINNAGMANPATGITSNSFFILDKTANGNAPNYQSPSTIEVVLNELLQQSMQTGVGGTLDQTSANDVFSALFASAGITPSGGNFFSAPDGARDTSFAPSGGPNFVNGDTVQTAGATSFPLAPTSPLIAPTTMPEPASLLVWGLGALGVGTYVRWRRSKKLA